MIIGIILLIFVVSIASAVLLMRQENKINMITVVAVWLVVTGFLIFAIFEFFNRR